MEDLSPIENVFFAAYKPEAINSQHAKQNGHFTCGGHFFSEHPGMGLTDVYAAAIPDLNHQAAVHVNYQETVLRVKDGLPKLKDFPAEMGGSGDFLPE